jgi:hypothetical protein
MAHEILDGEQLATMTVPSVMWYELNDGLQTVRAILAAIANNATRFQGRRGDETEAVTREFRQLEGLLASVANAPIVSISWLTSEREAVEQLVARETRHIL